MSPHTTAEEKQFLLSRFDQSQAESVVRVVSDSNGMKSHVTFQPKDLHKLPTYIKQQEADGAVVTTSTGTLVA